jgi:hypothetical protein
MVDMMIMIQKNTILITLCDSCADDYRNSGKYSIKREYIFNVNYEDCDKCKTRKGFDYSIKLKTI